MNDTSAASGTPGQQEEFVALHLKTTRASFDELDHDRVDPTAALEGLGGPGLFRVPEFTCLWE